MDNRKKQISNKTITIKDVAKEAGVSLATTSRALSGRGYSSEESRRKVHQAVRRLGYTPNDLARKLKQTRTDTIGLMITDIINPFYSFLASGVLDYARKLGYHVIVCATDEEPELEREYLNVLMKQRAAGVIAVPTGENIEHWQKAIKLGTKIVFVDREIEGLSENDVILVDNEQGASEAVEHLINLGHRRIGIITGPLSTTTGRGRLEGYLKTLRKHDIPISDELIKVVSFKGESGVQAAIALLDIPDRPTAIFAANNALAEATIHVLRQRHLRIPTDISLVVFDDVPWASLTDPPITAVYQPTYLLGRYGMEHLDRILNDDTPRPRQKIVLGTELIVRKSCSPPARYEKEVSP
jgi:LacI family transcriptional regulator